MTPVGWSLNNSNNISVLTLRSNQPINLLTKYFNVISQFHYISNRYLPIQIK